MAMDKLLLEEMSWPEVKEALDGGADCVIVPVASVEQHGFHLPENTDAVLGENAALELARLLGGALVAPAIRPGLSAHHMAFPGTLTLRPETLRMVIEDYADCYVRHGFRKIVLLSSHGGNVAACGRAAEELQAKYPQAVFAAARDVPTQAELREMEALCGFPAGTNGGHADERETSEMLALRPGLVHMERAEPGFTGELTPDLLERFFREGAQSLTGVGCVGDPRMADAGRGRWYISRAARGIAEALKRIF